jgi:hypothetical protein
MQAMKFCLHIFLMLASGLLPAQNASSLKFKRAWERDYLVNGELKYISQGGRGIELGVNVSKYNPRFFNALSDNVIFISSELKFNGKKNIIGPKIGFGLYILPYKLKGAGIHARCSSVLYDPSKTNDLRLLPEICFTFLGIINAGYGYSIPVSNHQLTEIPRHSLIMGFHFGYYRSIITVLDMSGGM